MAVIDAPRRGVIKVQGLSDAEHAAVERLAAIGNQHEGTSLPPLSGEESCQFLGQQHGRVIGFAGLYADTEPEAWGMVEPRHRRQGVGRALLDAVRDECRRRGFSECVLVVDEASPSGKAFLAAVGARYRYAEYRMALDPSAVAQSPDSGHPLEVREALPEDTEILIGITAAAFGKPEEVVRAFVNEEFQRGLRRFYLASLHGEPVGSLRVGFHGAGAYIATFGVLPAHQGRGYGRQILAEVTNRLLEEGRKEIVLEVVTENRRALSVYHACGFRERTTYGYYRVDVS